MASTEIVLTSGDPVVVRGAPDEVEKVLSDAARSGQSRLAWLLEPSADTPVAVNPAHVVRLRAASDG